MAKNTRRAQGTGSIYKKTVMRKGQEYTYWEAQVTVGADPGAGNRFGRPSPGRHRRKSGRRCRPQPWQSRTGTFLSLPE